MINYVFREYPYGNGEVFAQDEIEYAANELKQPLRIYSFCRNRDSACRRVPNGVEVVRVYDEKTIFTALQAFIRFVSPAGLRESYSALRTKNEESIIRRIYRVFSYYFAFCLMLKAVKKRSPASGDTFISYWLNECAFSVVGVKKENRDLCVVSRGHGFDVFPERCYLPFRKKILSDLDGVYVISEIGKRALERHYGVWLNMEKVKVVHLGVNLPNALPLATNGNNVSYNIVSCSSVIRLKRLDLVVEALAGIHGTQRKIHWTHIGGGVLFEQINALAQKRLTQENISYELIGNIPHDAVKEYYDRNAVHLFINCSDTEGIPVTIMEAMSYGIPAIARDVGGNSEIVDNTCGVLLSSNAGADEIRRGIERMMNLSAKEYDEKRCNAKSKVINDFLADKNARLFFESINGLDARRSK